MGVNALKQELENRGLNAKLIKMENSNYRQRDEDLVINGEVVV